MRIMFTSGSSLLTALNITTESTFLIKHTKNLSSHHELAQNLGQNNLTIFLYLFITLYIPIKYYDLELLVVLFL